MKTHPFFPKKSAVDDQRPDSPFELEAGGSYRQWREQKLSGYPRTVADLVVTLATLKAISVIEQRQLLDVCRKTNMVIYRTTATVDKTAVREFGQALGLHDLDRNILADDDGITSLQTVPGKSGRGYIPYSNKRLLWHTDGYYNPPARRIRSFLLHCVSAAANGGENRILDHEIAYILLRDQDPDYIRALMHPSAMTIPANLEDPETARAEQTGPVFFVDNGRLHMRYTARTRSVVWRDDTDTHGARTALEHILNSDSPYVFRYRLSPGEGLLCNNVLHNRTAFNDGSAMAATRLLYRARYYNRIAGT